MLQAFAVANEPLSLSKVAKSTNMSLPTATRYIRTLKDLGFLVADEKIKRYFLTSKILSLGFSYLNNMDFRTRLSPYLLSLNREFNVNANLAIIESTDILFVDRVKTASITHLNHTVGATFPAYCTALGKAIVAFLDPARINQIIENTVFTAFTPHTLTNKIKLLKELETIKKRGYAEAHQQISIGWSNYAVPIFRLGKVEGAIGTSFPYNMLKSQKKIVSQMLNKLLEISKESSIT